MKGLSTTIILVVTVVVILVAALVVLTIFGQGIQNVSTITQAQSMCMSEVQISCSTGAWPATWNSPTKRFPDGNARSCGSLFSSCSKCDDLKDLINNCKYIG